MPIFQNIQRPQRVLLYIALCALSVGVRVAYISYNQSYLDMGSAELELSAVSLAKEGTISNIYSADSGKSAHVSPLYPFFLSGLYRIFGSDTVAGRIFQELCAILATTVGFVLLPWVARRGKLSELAGWAAAFVLAILPVNLWIETSGSWEQPYSAIIVMVLIVVFCRLHDEQWSSWTTVIKGGVILGIISLLSPNVLPAGLLMILFELITQRGKKRHVVFSSLTMLAIAALIMAPWILRNFITFGEFIPFRSNLGLELAIGNNSAANGKTFTTSFDDPQSPSSRIHPFVCKEEAQRLNKMGELAYMREKQSKALRWMKENPIKTFELTLRRVCLYWVPPAELWPASSRATRFKAAIFSFFGFCTMISLAWLIVIRNDRRWLLASAVFGPSLIYMITHVDPRYRYPVFGLTTLLVFHLFVQLVKACFQHLHNDMGTRRKRAPDKQ